MTQTAARKAADRHQKGRNRITNDPFFLRGVDGRTMACRRFRDVTHALADDFDGDPPEAAKILIRHAAALTVTVEQLQDQVMAGKDADLEQLTRLSNALSRVLSKLGLRKPFPKGKGLSDYLGSER
jgi:hypothetical protein